MSDTKKQVCTVYLAVDEDGDYAVGSSLTDARDIADGHLLGGYRIIEIEVSVGLPITTKVTIDVADPEPGEATVEIVAPDA